jgi:hypothetical protein
LEIDIFCKNDEQNLYVLSAFRYFPGVYFLYGNWWKQSGFGWQGKNSFSFDKDQKILEKISHFYLIYHTGKNTPNQLEIKF